MKFIYQARTKVGEVRTGTIEASNLQGAADILRREDLFITLLKKENEGLVQKIRLFEGVSAKDVALFSRQLAVMFGANVSLVESLRVIGSQFTNQFFRERLVKISQSVEAGGSLSSSLAKYPDLFSPFFVSMVKAGEVSGNLSEQLNYLADYLEKQYYLSGKVKGAMVYPVVILIVMIGVVFLLSYFVMPNLVGMLGDDKSKLPMITQFVIGFSDFIRGAGGFVVLAAIAALPILGIRLFKTKNGKAIIDKISLKLPIFNNLLKMLYVTRFADNLSTLIAGGIPITQALEITASIVGNISYRDAILKSCEGVRKGQTISSTLFGYQELFPSMFTQMILVGEQTGSLDSSLLIMVKFYEKETERAIDGLLVLIEPIMIIILGLLVGGLIASVMIPLYQSMSNA